MMVIYLADLWHIMTSLPCLLNLLDGMQCHVRACRHGYPVSP